VRKRWRLPAYLLPDLNPIERAFAELQHALRRIGASSWERVVTAIGHVLTTITVADARAFIAAAGVPSP
jgi:transposase